jgi:serine protease Do
MGQSSRGRRQTGLPLVFVAVVLCVTAGAGQSMAQAPPAVGWLGISITEVGEDMADRLATTFGPDAGTGVLVADILKDGPAEKAGLHRGDVIVRVDAQPIWDVRQLQRTVRSRPVNQRVMITVLREASRVTLPVSIGAMPAQARAQLAGEPFGFFVREEDLGDARQSTPPPGGRIFVAFVDPGSSAAQAGLRPQDVILQVNNLSIQDMEEFDRAMGRAKGTVSLQVERRGSPTPLTLTLEPPRR